MMCEQHSNIQNRRSLFSLFLDTGDLLGLKIMATIDSESIEGKYCLLQCVKCGSRKFTKGTTNVSFVPHDTKFFKFKTNTVNARSKMCLECGFIEFSGDVEKAKYLTEE